MAHPLCGRGPQSAQSVPAGHIVYVAPRPPSSQSPSLANRHELAHAIGGEGEGGGGRGEGGGGGVGEGGGGAERPAMLPVAHRAPQSAQSVPYAQLEYSEPGPPSEQNELNLYRH